MGAWLEIIDTETGEKRRYRDDLFEPGPESGSEFNWKKNNYSCDCNRALFFAQAEGEDDLDMPCGDGRFYVACAECDDGRVVLIDAPRLEGKP